MNILSDKIKVYPTAYRGKITKTINGVVSEVVFNPESRFSTEENLTTPYILLAPHKDILNTHSGGSFVISENYILDYTETATAKDDDIFEFVLSGYRFRLENASLYLNIENAATSGVYAHIVLSDKTSESNFSSRSLIPFESNTKNNLDYINNNQGEFLGLWIDGNALVSRSNPTEHVYSLRLLDAFGKVPEASIIKYRLEDILGDVENNIEYSAKNRINTDTIKLRNIQGLPHDETDPGSNPAIFVNSSDIFFDRYVKLTSNYMQIKANLELESLTTTQPFNISGPSSGIKLNVTDNGNITSSNITLSKDLLELNSDTKIDITTRSFSLNNTTNNYSLRTDGLDFHLKYYDVWNEAENDNNIVGDVISLYSRNRTIKIHNGDAGMALYGEYVDNNGYTKPYSSGIFNTSTCSIRKKILQNNENADLNALTSILPAEGKFFPICPTTDDTDIIYHIFNKNTFINSYGIATPNIHTNLISSIGNRIFKLSSPAGFVFGGKDMTDYESKDSCGDSATRFQINANNFRINAKNIYTDSDDIHLISNVISLNTSEIQIADPKSLKNILPYAYKYSAVAKSLIEVDFDFSKYVGPMMAYICSTTGNYWTSVFTGKSKGYPYKYNYYNAKGVSCMGTCTLASNSSTVTFKTDYSNDDGEITSILLFVFPYNN